MFDAHIMFYAYDNVEGDEFGIGYIGNVGWWTGIVNRWGEQDGNRHDFTVDDWDEINVDNLRGCQLAEIEPDDKELLVTWVTGKFENSVKITEKGEILWKNNPQNLSSVPRWVGRLKKAIKEHNLQ